MRTLPATDGNSRRAAASGRRGGVDNYPTETVYGIGCAPQILEAAKRICLAKGRADNPLPLACSDTDEARRIVEFSPTAERLAERFWPGPLMLVLPAKVEYSVWITHGAKTLGVRVPDHQISQELAKLSGGVIVSTSANLSGEKPPTNASDAARQLGEKVDLILDGGSTLLTRPSTVIDLSGEYAQILRRGPITWEQIEQALGI
ncbi:MAG: threonylcarbamoyl-AMP synthase [Candidatus Bathyarchaeota archaeon]|nr:MAG: threonylcarbamoyl-AMP synthase [Candidatus Bathyarchaeota archaeon]